MKKTGFVAPWYGEKIGGGAEAELRGLIHHLADAGVPLEVLTTCAESFASDWSLDYHEPGLTVEAGIPVRRFRTRRRNEELFERVNRKLVNGRSVSIAEESIYCREMVNSPDLYEYMREHGDEYGLFVFIPYMFGTTYYGCQIHPEKSVLIPCLHDEAYAYMRCFRDAFSKVHGMIFHARPEQELARKLYGVQGDRFPVAGEGIDTDWEADPERFRRKFGIRDPFILYAGRKEPGKRVDVLVKYFAQFRKEREEEVKLVLIGGGKVENPDPKNIIDLGFVDKQDKYDAYAAAAFFCNPSEMESFSIVLMESWFAGRPVLVNGKCAVTTDFVKDANGGLYYKDYRELAACAEYLLSHDRIADAMGQNGREYVRGRFTWDVITKKYISLLQMFAEM